jgi:hypothetical protein
VYRAGIHGAAGRFTLVLPESYAPGWHLTGLPTGWTARHLIVAGYANAWLVSGTGNADLAIVYGPTRWSTIALVSSILAAVAAIALLLAAAVERTRHRRRRAGSDATADVPEEPAWQA